MSMGLGTILFGVSGNCEDREVTSLPDELPREPDSEKDTWRRTQTNHGLFKISDLCYLGYFDIWSISADAKLLRCPHGL